MLKRLFLFITIVSCGAILFAEDIASFVDEGFSLDGQYYVFGQYGNTEDSQGFAEIYTIDIEKNDYVDKGLFFVNPSVNTRGKNGHTLYTDLRKTNAHYINDMSLAVTGIDNVLYLNSGLKSANEEIVVKDFENTTNDFSETYSITLNPWYGGNTASSKSSFFITVEKKDEKGVVIGKQVIGNPDIKRTGVIGYDVEKIITSPDRSSFIFIIEKTIATTAGNTVRYMVETLEVADFN